MKTVSDIGENQLHIGDFVVFADTMSVLNTGIINHITDAGGVRISYITGSRRRVERAGVEYVYKCFLAEQYANCKDCLKLPGVIAHPNILKRPYWIGWDHQPEYAEAKEKFLQEGLKLLYELKAKLLEPKEETD